jgi:hypothetical protein
MTKRRLRAVTAALVLSVAGVGVSISAAHAQPGSAASTKPSPLLAAMAADTALAHSRFQPLRAGQKPPTAAAPRMRPKSISLPPTPKAVAATPATPPDGTLLPARVVRSILVDATDSRLFMTSYDGVVSTGLDGSDPTLVIGGTAILNAAVDGPNHLLFARVNDKIAVVDTRTGTELNLINTSDSPQISQLAYSDGKVWYYDSWLAGVDKDSAEIQVLDITSGAHGKVSVPGVTGVADIANIPGRPNELSIATSAGQQWFSVSGETLTAGPLLPSGCGNQLTSDGSELLCDGTLRRASDLTAVGTYSTSLGTVGAASVGGMAYMGSSCQDDNSILSVVRAGATEATRTYNVYDNSTTAVAYNADGTKLYAVTQILCGSAWTPDGTLRIIDNPNFVPATLTLTMPGRTTPGATSTVAGNLSFEGETYAGTRALHVTRTDNAGTHTLPDVTPDSTGNFTIKDAATPLGLAKYTVTFVADGVHEAASASAQTTREVPWDVNDDGYADAVIGSPGEDIGTATDAGDITVMYGHATGVTGTGAVEFDQNSTGVPGDNESGDQFGYATVSGDFNHDGFPDVAVSGNGQDTGSATNAGAIWVFYGSTAGLSPSNVQMITIDETGLGVSSPYSNSYFGEAMAVGDFNGDGYDDIAAGAVSRNVIIMFGSAQGINTNQQSMDVLAPGDNGIPSSNSTFGFSLSAGDVNGDGISDLAIGSPYDYTGLPYSVGSVAVVYGNASGQVGVSGSQRFTPDTAGVPGSSHTFGAKDMPDSFGWQVVLADFNGDGKADLAIGAPGTPVVNTSSHEDAGTVTVLYSAAGKIGTTGATLITEDTTSMPGVPGTNDNFGAVLSAGDTNHDGKADLAIYSPGDTLVTVVRGGASGLSFSTAIGWTQNSTGVPGSTETGDDWGGSLRFESFTGTAKPQAMMVGAAGENTGQGAVTFVYGATSGLTGTGSTSFSQNSAGIPGASENGDWFGSFLSY